MKKKKKLSILKFILLIFIFGFISGILFFFLKNNLDYSYYVKDFIYKAKNYNQSLVLYNSSLVFIIYFLSLSLLGIFLILPIIFVEACAIGFTISLFFYYLGIKGLIFYFLFFIESKLINYILLLYFSFMSINFVIKVIASYIGKNASNFYKSFFNQFSRFIIVLFLTILNSLMIKYLFKGITTYLIKLL